MQPQTAGGLDEELPDVGEVLAEGRLGLAGDAVATARVREGVTRGVVRASVATRAAEGCRNTHLSSSFVRPVSPASDGASDAAPAGPRPFQLRRDRGGTKGGRRGEMCVCAGILINNIYFIVIM